MFTKNYTIQYPVPLLGFAATSGTGKTSLLEQLIPLLCEQGLRVAVIKHSHHNVEIDQEGKDSFRLRRAGALSTTLTTPYRRISITEHTIPQEPSLSKELNAIAHLDLDIILVEGFRDEAFPKIELYRAELQKPLRYPNDSHIIAVAANCRLVLPSHLTWLDLNQPRQLMTFILQQLLNYDARSLSY